jgi:hypothetical protein
VSERVPEFRVRAVWLVAQGAMAPRIPGDVVVVPVSLDGTTSGRRVELGLALASTRTVVTFFWDELRDRGGNRILLEGADRWGRRAVSVRQRVVQLSRDGAHCDIVLGADENWLDAGDGGPLANTIRRAILERRRVSGGVALMF